MSREMTDCKGIRGRMDSKKWLAITVAGCLIRLAGCGSSGRNSFPAIDPVVQISAQSGSPQSHAIDGAFGTLLVAMVTSNGLPASGVVVSFTAPSTGPGGTFGPKGTSTTTATTDANGLATSSLFTANGKVGIYTVTASAPGVPTAAVFDLTNTVGAPASVTAMSGNAQSASVQQSFTNPLQVMVVDGGNNPVSNAMVVFTAPATGASSIFSDTATNTTTALTNANGVATSAPFSANGVAGSDNIVASASGATSATFGLTNLAGPAQTISVVSGTPQSAIANQTYGAALSVLVVDSQQNPVANTAVTFTAPASATAASVTFTNASNTITVTTNSSGVASSGPFRANAVAGTFSVNANETADFTLTNWPLGSQYYSFYLRGQDILSFSFYGLAGSVLISPTGSVLAGEQDYNDAFVVTSPQPSGDSITGGALTLDSTTEQGTLVLDTNNLNVGNAGVETFAVQFVNSNHALIAEYDGTLAQGSVVAGATSSGSLDLQTLPSASPSNLGGSYAFTLAGVDPFFFPVAYGGVFSITGGGQTLQSGLLDTNDTGLEATTSVVTTTDVPMSGTLSLPDSFGRGTLTIPALNYNVLEQAPSPISLNYYIVGPEVIRIIDVDSGDTAVGSAFGQGGNATASSNASLGSSIFGVEGTALANQYGAAGMFSTNGSGTISNGVADDSELAFSLTVPDAPISGTYSVAANGYGSLTIAAGDLGDVSAFGLYMTDPALNLLDPNNTTSGLGGGALLLDLDTILGGGTGVVIPQTSTGSTFDGQYAFAGQDQNCIFFCGEFDFVGEADVTTGLIQTPDAFLSDPFTTLGELNPTNTAKFDGTPQADSSNAGRFTMLSTNATPNPLDIKVSGVAPQPFNVVMYQANADQFFWLDEDAVSVFLGSLQQFGSFTTVPSANSKSKAAK